MTPISFRRASLAVLLFAASTPVSAQIGHDPSRSPYRDILFGKTLTINGGSVGGDGGKLGIGPHHGTAIGIRYDRRISTPLQVGFTIGYAKLERLIVDANDSVHKRVSGPVDQRVATFGLDIQFNVTGKKTWHRLAPYAAVGIGLTTSSATPADTSGYRFGSKVYLSPAAGVRLFLSNSLHLRVEAREVFWRLKYPTIYLNQPSMEPGDPLNGTSNAVIQDRRLAQWTGTRQLTVGLGYAVAIF